MKWGIKPLEIGDHIRVKRSFYYHHGVYIGDGSVIHYCGISNDSISNPSEVEVRITSIDFFAREGIVEKPIYSKKEKKNLVDKEIAVKHAINSLGNKEYDFYRNNCEDFAVRCCYKTEISTQLKSKNNTNFLLRFIYLIVRVFIKITGFFAYIVYLKPRYMYVSDKAKKEFRKNKNGAIICANHTSIFDFYVLFFKFVFKHTHTMVADVVYKKPGLRFLNNVLGNIEIKRDGSPNIDALDKASMYLRQNKIVIIFPEGKLEDKKNVLESFHDSAAYLSIKEKKDIIPVFIDGKYGLFKRPLIVVGERINFGNGDIDPYDNKMIAKSNKIIQKTIQNLEIIGSNSNKYQTRRWFAPKLWMLDFLKITSIPLFYLVFPTKKVFLCDKKEFKNVLKYNFIFASNHHDICDVFFLYQHFLSRRIKVVASDIIWTPKVLRYGLDHGGVIKYRKSNFSEVDYDAFKEIVGTLQGQGAVAIFPEGHYNLSSVIENNIKTGAAAFSLLTNSPILPFMFEKKYRPFKKNVIYFGKPIYPSDYFDLSKGITNEDVKKYNDIVYKNLKNIIQ